MCVIEGVAGLDEEALAVNLSLASIRQEVIKPKVRSLTALMGADPKDYDQAEIVQMILRRTTRALM